MTDPHLEEELLHRYFDGDLRAEEASEVAGHLTTCDHCTGRHGQLSELRRLITVAAEQSTVDVNFDRAFAHVERGIRAQAEASLFERVTGWLKTAWQEHPEQIWAPAMGAAAAAALLFVLAKEPTASNTGTAALPHGESAPGAVAEQATPEPEVAAPDTLPADALALANSEVLTVDSAGSAVTLYEIDLADGVSTPVVWINDDVLQ